MNMFIHFKLPVNLEILINLTFINIVFFFFSNNWPIGKMIELMLVHISYIIQCTVFNINIIKV